MKNFNRSQLLEKVIAWIHDANQETQIDIVEDTKILEESMLDSMDLLNLITNFEQEFGIEIDETFLIPENFETPAKIVDMVEQNLGGSE